MAKFARQWTAEQVAAIVLASVDGRSARSLAAEHGCAPSTITRLLRAPDVAELVAGEKAKLAEAAAVERRRITSRESTRRHRERQAREAAGVHPTGDPKQRPTTGGRIVGQREGVPSAYRDDADFAAKQQAKRERPLMQPVTILAPPTIPARTIWPRSVDPDDAADIEMLAAHLQHDLGGRSNDIAHHLRLATEDGETYVATYDDLQGFRLIRSPSAVPA